MQAVQMELLNGVGQRLGSVIGDNKMVIMQLSIREEGYVRFAFVCVSSIEWMNDNGQTTQVHTLGFEQLTE